MISYREIICPQCQGNQIQKAGRSANGTQRYGCQSDNCPTKTFMQEYRYRAYQPSVKEQIIDMAINGSGIRDTAHVLKALSSTQ